jgi:glutamate formiminotransferase
MADTTGTDRMNPALISESDAPLVLCVPNFSEGRDRDGVDAIAQAIAAVPGVMLLDRSSDADHHRSVITFAGPPSAVETAMLAGAAVACARIDLTAHRGVHPRVGAVDVVPFVALRGMTLADAAALARRWGAHAAETLGVPVYLYGAAAAQPERRELAFLRRGGYEGLAARMAAGHLPDFGPAAVGRAGAVLVGAREPLIAFNATLDTDDVQVARAIAGELREAGGGLPTVRALGLKVGARAQVSMNLTDYRRVSLFTVWQALMAAAARHGVGVLESELVGLIPENALIDSALALLHLPPATRARILERALGAAGADDSPLFE